jgi:hypothetical protein
MKKSILGIIAIGIVGTIAVYAISPFFTESTIDEEIPMGVFTQQKMEDDTMMEDDSMMRTIPTSYSGIFEGTRDGIHDVQGKAYSISLENGNRVLRLAEFKSTNGPDLYVYLSDDKNASDFISLGKLKANQGNQNYDIPNEVALDKYNQVLIWCKTFGVLFGSAEISPQI